MIKQVNKVAVLILFVIAVFNVNVLKAAEHVVVEPVAVEQAAVKQATVKQAGAGIVAPWGYAGSLDIQYKPQKVLYDLTASDPKDLDNILDRVSALFKIYDSNMFDSSIVIIVHGDAIPFFAIENFSKYKKRMQRANSLTVGTTIEFRMCKMAARLLNYTEKDIHGFVSMVPMADAEIVRLQNEEGYAYMY